MSLGVSWSILIRKIKIYQILLVVGVLVKILKMLSIIKIAKSKKPKLTKFNSSKTNFLTLKAKETFIYLQKVFTKALILRHFDPKCYIYIKTNTSGYIISEILSQINLN